MDLYDPNFNPETYDSQQQQQQEQQKHAYDPDMDHYYGKNTRQPPTHISVPAGTVNSTAAAVAPTEIPVANGDEIHEVAPVPAVTNNNHANVNYDPHYDDYPVLDDDDIPRHVGEGYSDDDGSYGDDGFGDDDDVYMDNHRNNASPEIESSDPKDNIPDVFLRNCILTCTCLFLLSGLIVLGIRINQISNEDAAKKEIHISKNVGLIPPPLDLADKCSAQQVLSERGFYECEELCEPADCCSYPTTLALSCLAGHEDQCLNYHEHCSVLQLDQGSLANPPQHPTDLPEAPRDIKQKCNMESLRTVAGFEGCVNDCMQAACCWKKDGSVHPCTSLEVCDGYAACLTMDVTDHINTNINKEIEEKCADDRLTTESGHNQCVFACSHAACCFDPGTECPHADKQFCTQYQACQKIYDANGQVIDAAASSNPNNIPVAPQFLHTACAESSLQTLPGYEMCLGACSEAECCWKGERSCVRDSLCDGYESCTNLMDQQSSGGGGSGSNNSNSTATESVPDAPEYLDAACSSDSLDTSAGFEMCQDACMNAECCWKAKSCTSLPECTSYKTNCANLVARLDGGTTDSSGTSFIPEAPQDLEQTCDPSNVLTTSGFEACQSTCENTKCCWEVGNSNSCVSNADCKAWAPCTVMNGAAVPSTSTAAPQDSSTGGTSSPASEGYTLEQVFDACLNHDNNIGSSHQSLCQIVCQAGNCCFDDTKDCPGTVDCKIYDPCQVLHSETASNVEKACDGSDLAECVGICAEATCCFTNDISKICDMTNPNVICRQYKACEILYGAEVSNP